MGEQIMTTTTEEGLKVVKALQEKEEAIENLKIVESFLKTTNEGEKTLKSIEAIVKLRDYLEKI